MLMFFSYRVNNEAFGSYFDFIGSAKSATALQNSFFSFRGYNILFYKLRPYSIASVYDTAERGCGVGGIFGKKECRKLQNRL